MAGVCWSSKEEEILFANYGKCKKAVIQNLLPNRTWVAIKLHAKFLNLKYFVKVHDYVEGDLTVLLDDLPESFYWMGFLAADGSFVKNRLKLTLAKLDSSHVVKFANFISCKNHREIKNGYELSIQDSINVPKIVKKYDLRPRKTYNPPNVTWMDSEVCIPFFIGFVDGDGSIGFQHKRKDCILRIKIHSSWTNTLQSMVNVVSRQVGVSPPKVKLTKAGYANVCISNSIVLKFLKKMAKRTNLPILKRKWDKIDETFVSRMEQSEINRINVFFFKEMGLKNSEIASRLGLSRSTVSLMIKQLKNNFCVLEMIEKSFLRR